MLENTKPDIMEYRISFFSLILMLSKMAITGKKYNANSGYATVATKR
jgi:hypothetical protein